MNFKVRNAPLTITSAPPVVKRAIAFLDTLDDGELIEGYRALGAEVGFHPGSIKAYTQHPELLGYRAQHPSKRDIYWGNKATVAAFRKKFCNE